MKVAAKLEISMEKLRHELASLDDKMAQSAQNFSKLGELESQRQSLSQSLADQEEEWLEATSRAEELTEELSALGRQ